MNRALTVIFCALEALLVVGIGVGISLVPLSLLWAFEYGLQVDWAVFWRVAADAWLIGHGVDVHVPLGGDATELFGVDAVQAFDITIAALGFALVTVLLAVRAGRRIATTPHRRLGFVTATAIFGILALGVVASASHPAAQPSLVQGVVLPTLVFSAGLALGARRARGERLATRTAVTDVLGRVPDKVRVVVGASLRGGIAAVAGVMIVSALACATLIGVSYAEVVALYESVHTGVLGGIALTLGQLVLAPNMVLWAAAWFVGPGIAIGVGSSVGPLATNLGTIPVVPVFGAVPVEAPEWGFIGLLVPIVAAFIAGWAVRPALSSRDGHVPLAVQLSTGAGIGVAGGSILAVLTAAAAGSVGPGRLAVVGADPVLVGLWAALEFAVAATIGIVTGSRARDD